MQNASFRLPDNNVVVITGAAGGIGGALATVFAQCGAAVALCDVDNGGAQLVAALPHS